MNPRLQPQCRVCDQPVNPIFQGGVVVRWDCDQQHALERQQGKPDVSAR